MGKTSQRRTRRYERGQAGCMWGLISMFDFRHGRANQKLLSDRRPAAGNAVSAAGLLKDKLDRLTSLHENCGGTLDGEDSTVTATDSNKPSVKKLMEEEMFSEKGLKKEMDNGGREPKQSNSEQVDHRWKNSRRTRRGRSKSCDIHLEDLTVTENLRSEWPGINNLQKRSTRSLDFDEIMEEFCRQIQQKNTDYVHDQHDEDEVNGQPNWKNLDFEEKLGEAIKLFISQKLINMNCIKEDGDLQPSKELRDALKILSSNEDLVLKHLQGRKSIMVKYLENVWNAKVGKDDDFKSNMESNLFEQPKEGVSYEQRNFRRRSQSSEQTFSGPGVTSQASNRFMVWKPRHKGLQHPGAEGNFHSSSEFPSMIRNPEPTQRVGSYFFLTELKRKLKNAMGKERQEASVDGTLKIFPNGYQVVRDGEKGSKDNVGRKSPNKDHFFTGRIARPSKGVKKVEKANQLQECEASIDCEAGKYCKQRLTNLYIEAKKHLSEILSDEAGDVEFPSEHIPKTLGRILSLPENNSSPGSPGRDSGQVAEKLNVADESQKQDDVSHLGQGTINAESQLCIYDNNTDGSVQAPISPNSNELLDNDDLEKASCAVGDKMISKGAVEIVSAMEIQVCGENSTRDTASERSSSSVIVDDQDGDSSEASDELRNSECLKHYSAEETQAPASPSTCPSTSFTTEKVEEIQEASYMTDRPSPVSVLEPLFPGDDISPASIKSHPIELPMQPLRIQFEDVETSAAEQDILLETCDEDKESMFEYVKAILLASGMKWDDLHIKSYSSDQLLDPSICDEMEFFTDLLCCDKKLVFDCVNEVLMEICMQYLGCFTGLSIIKPIIRPFPDMKNAIYEVWEGVQRHLLPLPLPHTLDQIVKKDMSKSGLWMDLRYDAEAVIIEIGQAIFDDLMEETALVFGNKSLNSGNAYIPAAL